LLNASITKSSRDEWVITADGDIGACYLIRNKKAIIIALNSSKWRLGLIVYPLSELI